MEDFFHGFQSSVASFWDKEDDHGHDSTASSEEKVRS
jgi:hypothetical protein